MPTFNKIIGESETGQKLIPEERSVEILQEMPKQSVALTRARRTTMSSKTQTQPVLSALPEAKWVNGPTGLKETSSAQWEGLTMTAEELAVIVPIPDVIAADASIDLWDAVKPLVAQAMAKKIDEAILFGTDKPASWPDALIKGAEDAGNFAAIDDAKKVNIADAALAAAGKVAAGGFSVNGFVSSPGLGWTLRGLKDDNGGYYYGAPGATGVAASLFGFPLDEVTNGAWDDTKAALIMADWSKIVVGVRQDITYEVFREGVISDNDGKVILNLMQQDTKAMRVVMRLGYQVANPVTTMQGAKAKRYPAGFVKPAATTPGRG